MKTASIGTTSTQRTAKTKKHEPVASDLAYQTLEVEIARRISEHTGPLFTTDATGLYEAYLKHIKQDRQHYNCRACQQFIERFGGLVTISSTGHVESLLWQESKNIPKFFKAAVAAMYGRVTRAKITGVFLARDATWGQPVAGGFTHLSGQTTDVFRHALLSAEQAMAEKVQEYEMLDRCLGDFSRKTIKRAITLLETGTFSRAEKVIATAQWLLGVHDLVDNVRGQARQARLWYVVATAPTGFCHLRGGVLGTLLQDIDARVDTSVMKRRWDAKMEPDQYQRPQAPPSAGTIDQAEKIVVKLDSEGALRRRFARLEDVINYAIWTPKRAGRVAEPQEASAVFGHLRNQPPRDKTELPQQVMTWVKFQQTVLPKAQAVELIVPAGRQNFFAMTDAADPTAPPILQWDGVPLRERNAVSCYTYTDGSLASNWRLTAGGAVRVNAILPHPAHFQEPTRFQNQAQVAALILDGARDRSRGGLGLFPETLRSEYHSIRSVIEAHSNKRGLEGGAEASACGLVLVKGGMYPDCRLRVSTADTIGVYKIDRWD